MTWYDWLILIVPACFVLWMGYRSRRYIRGVTDYLSAGRLCGRYVISIGAFADNSISIIGLVTYIEMHYKTGFSVAFWGSLLAPLGILLSLTGYCAYRWRETKAMSIGQFLEMRYSRSFRIFAAALRSLCEMLANMIMPAVAARFFIRMLDLPDVFHVLGIPVSTYVALMVLFLTISVTIICWGGTLCLLVTDTIQGMFLYPILALFVIFLLHKFSISQEVIPVMMDRAPGESFINPYDIYKLRDFNFFTMVVVAVYGRFMNRLTWSGAGYDSAAKTPHEQKMAGILGQWRSAISTMFHLLIACALITFLNHRDFAVEAGEVRRELASRAADDVLRNDAETRAAVQKTIAEIPPQVHEIGVDPPLSQESNLDTAFLDEIHRTLTDRARANANAALDASGVTGEEREKALIDAEGRANDTFQQCRTLFNQLNLSVTMRRILPSGLFGLFALLLFLAMVSTDDSRIYSAALTIAQDVVLPLRKKPFTPREHVWMIRLVTIGVGLFFLCGSYFMQQLDYIHMFVTLVCTMWVCGAGPILVFGIYSRLGTTAGAWACLGTSTVLSTAYVFIQRSWADVVYPAIAKAGLVDSFDRALRALSSPFAPWIEWHMDAVKCPVNPVEFSFFLSLLSMVLYLVVSKVTCRVPFNLERMLHRGKYSLGEKRDISRRWTPRTILANIIGITPEYSRGDRIIAWGVFFHGFVFSFCVCFLSVVIWNAVSPWPIAWWGRYFLVIHFIVPGIVSTVATLWLGIGGAVGLVQLFRDLKARTEVNVLDDGRVEGSMSLADKQALEAVDKPGDTAPKP